MGNFPTAGLLLSVALFGFFGIANSGIPLESTHEDYVHVNIVNTDDHDIDDALLKAYAYDTGQESAAKEMDIDDNSNAPGLLQFVISGQGIQRQDYEPVRVVLFSNDIRAVRHVWVLVG